MSQVAGIIGGMGPLSTAELIRKVFEKTPAATEQEHIRMLIDNYPQIPDRTAYILGQGPSPLPRLQTSARLLQQWGADFLAIACNTAHLFIEEISTSVNIPVLNMLQLLREELLTRLEEGSLVALLTTSGAIKSGLFESYLKRYQIVLPPEDLQRRVIMEIIYGSEGVKLKAPGRKQHNQLQPIFDFLLKRKISLVIAGCTEIGMALADINPPPEVINPLDLLAREIVKRAF